MSFQEYGEIVPSGNLASIFGLSLAASMIDTAEAACIPYDTSKLLNVEFAVRQVERVGVERLRCVFQTRLREGERERYSFKGAPLCQEL